MEIDHNDPDLFSYVIESKNKLFDEISNNISKRINIKSFCLEKYKYESKQDDNLKISLILHIPIDWPVHFSYEDTDMMLIRKRNGIVHDIAYFETLIIKSKSNEKIIKLIKEIIEEFEHSNKNNIKHQNLNQNLNKDKISNNIDIYVYEKIYWHHTTIQSKRSIDTIYLDEDIKKQILEDVKSFINNKDQYDKYGIPYKRNYLFSGPSGTGKTSMIYAIASELNLNIGIFKMTSEKQSLEQAYRELPKNTIMLIEDIEHYFLSEHKEIKNFDMSELLNVLDGIIMKEQLLTFITTNRIERIPINLLRPGRIDEIYMFDYSTKKQIMEIHQTFCPGEDSEKFYSKVKNMKLTPAILQKFLFKQNKKRKISELEEIVDMTVDKKIYINNYI